MPKTSVEMGSGGQTKDYNSLIKVNPDMIVAGDDDSNSDSDDDSDESGFGFGGQSP